jgi:hypothetical protein
LFREPSFSINERLQAGDFFGADSLQAKLATAT